MNGFPNSKNSLAFFQPHPKLKRAMNEVICRRDCFEEKFCLTFRRNRFEQKFSPLPAHVKCWAASHGACPLGFRCSNHSHNRRLMTDLTNTIVWLLLRFPLLSTLAQMIRWLSRLNCNVRILCKYTDGVRAQAAIFYRSLVLSAPVSRSCYAMIHIRYIWWESQNYEASIRSENIFSLHISRYVSEKCIFVQKSTVD